jgi:hypothetical protein
MGYAAGRLCDRAGIACYLVEQFDWWKDRHRVAARQRLRGRRRPVARRVELVFDPFDLTRIEVRYHGRPMGQAVPHRIGRHVHAKARPEAAAPTVTPTGIDYLRLVEAKHTAELAGRLRYTELTDDGQIPGQLDLTQPEPTKPEQTKPEHGEAL